MIQRKVKHKTVFYLIVKNFDLLEDIVLDEAVEDGAVDLAEELAGVQLVLGNDDEAVVVQDVALHRVVLAGDLVPSLPEKTNQINQ
jgi:hypothetical protein